MLLSFALFARDIGGFSRNSVTGIQNKDNKWIQGVFCRGWFFRKYNIDKYFYAK